MWWLLQGEQYPSSSPAQVTWRNKPLWPARVGETKNHHTFWQQEKKKKLKTQPPFPPSLRKQLDLLSENAAFWIFPWAATDGFQRSLHYYNSTSVPHLFLPLQKTSSWFNPRSFTALEWISCFLNSPALPPSSLSLRGPVSHCSHLPVTLEEVSKFPFGVSPHSPGLGSCFSALQWLQGQLWDRNMNNQRCSAFPTPGKHLEHLPWALAMCLLLVMPVRCF